jgi:hypothetical protein
LRVALGFARAWAARFGAGSDRVPFARALALGAARFFRAAMVASG